jgi:putative membrane protein
MTRFSYSALSAAALFLAPPAFAQDATSSSTPQDPAQFATMAASSNLLEIQSSNLALEQSETEEVRTFAEHMIEDHTAASEKMMTAAEADGVTVPAQMEDRHQAMLEDLAAAEGADFDALYLQMQVQAHEEAVALFDAYDEADTNLGAFAAETLPTLEEHLTEVQQLTQ